ncbi:MAG: hypothetical protein A2857_06615 [Candidatus Levybacteria bacterium RIFCSPHIGHO2_01_FULL_36_15]|nr:MAG: hypothetical protein A2857_06615 [Candidatus Levybacteria bacterium RIFCSPHIGHO2_01_FULL_36_15]OGH38807.1 MAG: hypothetical protein A2905_02500 [Candidatus Levybacteria bacterium RIFCSPLOWO2_01_FULL_36_10]
MVNEAIFTVAAFSLLTFNTYLITPPEAPTVQERVLVTREISLEERYADKFVNDVFKDNILLTMAYLRGEKIDSTNVDWNLVKKPFSFKMGLKPGKTFAFHEDILPEYLDKVTKTTGSRFNYQDGFKSDGYLTGDGVCHLASLINWAAADANLNVKAPTNHDFAVIPGVPGKFGTSIYVGSNQTGANALQNLYVTNNYNKPIIFAFSYDGKILKLSVAEVAFN